MKNEDIETSGEFHFDFQNSGADIAASRNGIYKNYARCFATADGAAVLRHLQSITVGRFLGANATEAELRGLEAQRVLVHQIAIWIKRGK
jgi:hypothetical protein